MRACIYILLLKVLLTSGVHQNYSYYDCKAGYLAPHEDCNIAHIDLPKTYPVAKSAIDELPDPHCVYKCIEAEACIVAPPECPVPPICPPCETTVCAKGQKACGTTPDENELCPPDEVCIPEDCECRETGKDGKLCEMFCAIKCGEFETHCIGGLDDNGCKKPDSCVLEISPGCPGLCPVVCGPNEGPCPVADVKGCPQAPACVAKEKDDFGGFCDVKCPCLCDEGDMCCASPELANGCSQDDFCHPKGSPTVPTETGKDGKGTTEESFCSGFCPVECKAHEKFCKGQVEKDGCSAPDICLVKAKDDEGVFCPENSASHGCSCEDGHVLCEDGEVCCPAQKGPDGCLGVAVCTKMDIGIDEEYCPSESVCPIPCKAGEFCCSAGYDDNGCKKPDLRIPKTPVPGVPGDYCPAECPGECAEDEITCEGEITVPGCKGLTTCHECGVKITAPDPEEIGEPCPCYCPRHCEENEIKCPPAKDCCYGCDAEEVCRVAAKDIHGSRCPADSASHNCPSCCGVGDACEVEVLCPSYEDETGCKPPPLCMELTKGNDGSLCPAHSVCPVSCGANEVSCATGFDSNGCKKADQCVERGHDSSGMLCPAECPAICDEEIEHSCCGHMQLNGCQAPDFCEALLVGDNGEDCKVHLCSLHCTGTEIMIESKTDDNGCPLEYRCIEPKTFTTWENDGTCVATATDSVSLLPCGPGTQQQTRTCTDGTIDLCTDADVTSKSVACALVACTVTVEAKCQEANLHSDIGLVLDVSGSVGSHWPEEKQFAIDLVETIGLSQSGGHVSVILFDHKSTLDIKFTDFFTNKEFETKLHALKHRKGGTEIATALNLTLTEMFQETNGMRPANPQTCVLMTDGKSNSAVDFKHFKNSFQAANIKLLVVGIGKNLDAGLADLVQTSDDFVIVKDFAALNANDFFEKTTMCD